MEVRGPLEASFVRQTRGNKSEYGSVLPLMAVLLVATAAAIWGLATYGSLLIERAEAQSAADAAALAAGLGSDDDARLVANANGATLVWIKRSGAQVEVKVQVGRAHARARAEIERHYQGPRYETASIP
ncbi:MAG: pilus assembly protein TadG-related protein [Acidimicrobiia bacterium]